jgi:hypothetical protein
MIDFDDFKDSAIAKIKEAFVGAIELFPYEKFVELFWPITKRLNIFVWRSIAIAQSAGTGAGLMLIPGLNVLIGVGSDLFALFYAMQATAYGVGMIVAKRNGRSEYALDREDYTDILSIWVGSPEFIDNAHVKALLSTSYAAAKISAKFGTKLSAKALSGAVTIGATASVKKIGLAISPQLMGKILTKIGAKLGIKTGSSWVPGVGSALNAGVNAWFINDITNAAKIYYIAKFEGNVNID